MLGGSLSISFTAKWDAFNTWSRVVDFGCGPASDNITITNFEKGKTLVADVYRGTSRKRLLMSSALTVGKSHRYLFTVSDTGCMRMLRDGQLLGELVGGYVPREVDRLHLLVGGSNWPTDGGFHGCVAELSVWRGVLEWSAAFPEHSKVLSETELDTLPVVGEGSKNNSGRSMSAAASLPAAATEMVNAGARADATSEVSPSVARPVAKKAERKARKSRERPSAALDATEEQDKDVVTVMEDVKEASQEATAEAPVVLPQEPTIEVPEVMPQEVVTKESLGELPASQKLTMQPVECEGEEAVGSLDSVAPVPAIESTSCVEGLKTEGVMDTASAISADQQGFGAARDTAGTLADEATVAVEPPTQSSATVTLEAPVQRSKAPKKGWGSSATTTSASEVLEVPVQSSKPPKKGWGSSATTTNAPELSATRREDARADPLLPRDSAVPVEAPSKLLTQVEPCIAKEEIEKSEPPPEPQLQRKAPVSRTPFDATSSRTPLEREILKWEKKAREIDRLQRRLADGEELEPNQLEKILKSEEVEKRLVELHEQHAAEQAADDAAHAASAVTCEGINEPQETDIKTEDDLPAAWPVAAGQHTGGSISGRTPLRAPPPGKQQWIPGATESSTGKGKSMPWQKGKTSRSWEAGCGLPNPGPTSTPETFVTDADPFGDGVKAQVPPPIPTMDGWMSEGMAGHPPHSLPPTLTGSLDFSEGMMVEGQGANGGFMDASGVSAGALNQPDYSGASFGVGPSLGPGGPTGPMEVLIPPANGQFQDRWECCWEWVTSGWCPRGLTCRWEHPQLTPLTYPLYD
jgi:hypothetical protein